MTIRPSDVPLVAEDTDALLACARESFPECDWAIVDNRDGLALQASDADRHVRIIRYVREDPAAVVVESARKHLRKAKRMEVRV